MSYGGFAESGNAHIVEANRNWFIDNALIHKSKMVAKMGGTDCRDLAQHLHCPNSSYVVGRINSLRMTLGPV